MIKLIMNKMFIFIIESRILSYYPNLNSQIVAATTAVAKAAPTLRYDDADLNKFLTILLL